MEFPANVYNDMRAMLKWWKSQERRSRKDTGKKKISDRHTQSRTVVANNTGADLAMYDCAQIGPPQSDDNAGDYVKERLLYASATKFDSVSDNVCVALEPIKAGELGLVAVAGICIANVEVTNLQHRYAAPVIDNPYLSSGGSSRIRIISVLDSAIAD